MNLRIDSPGKTLAFVDSLPHLYLFTCISALCDTLLDTNDASCKRTSYIHTKHRMNLSYFLSVKNMLEVLQHDHITVNTTIYCVIQQLLFMSR